MIATDFNSKICEIEKSIVILDSNLKTNRFSGDIKIKYQNVLNDLFTLLENDQKKHLPKISVWNLAFRIVRLKSIESKLQKIIKKLRPPFINKTQNLAIPSLKERVDELKRAIEIKGRLPFSVKGERSRYFQDVKQVLQLKNEKKIIAVQKEYFHLLSNHLDSHSLKQVNVKPYEGNIEIYSLVSWKQVLNLFIREGDESEKRVGLALLNILNHATPHVIKSSFIFDKVKESKENDIQDIRYFKDYLKSHKPKSYKPTKSSSFEQAQFLKKYVLKPETAVPERVIINEIAWDMVESIKFLQLGDLRIFPLGIRSHAIVVEVTCMDESSNSTEKKYQYKIFNTGAGVDPYHEEIEEFVHPLIYRDVPLSAFSYSFISNLIRMSLDGYSIDDFYKLHDTVLVEEAGGEKNIVYGELYNLQQYGICSYSSLEAWIHSYLSEKEIDHMNLIKAQLSIKKQKKVIQIQEKASRHFAEQQWLGMRKRRRPSYLEDQGKSKRQKIDEELRKEIKESKLFLKLGQQYLQEAEQIFTNS